ncbi:unnamed protein product [Adineta steineri]|uniref:DUF4246 domain-containing protein n=1 Tax=Adineta steineri TaxID=433720 RepID=A0A815VB32_9BILA|nr:unnamed protein product [Adineta steineri]CAF1150295.1 unnamed protein product [Adineta steineri]CAF1529738.1 unnamed protein product [Adineta steineri]CAF3664004.1 unnamed protein product [Adineta steineri]CAF3735600.1 unnamed protein product [Adineta steineri]
MWSNDYNNDEIDDNMSDEDEWSRNTERIAERCSLISFNDDYCQPSDFDSEHVTYGGYGSMTLKYPIWVCDHLSKSNSNLESDMREELLEVFYALNDKHKDFHKYPSPVEDIIDPDLLVCKPIEPLAPPSAPAHSSYQDWDNDDNESSDDNDSNEDYDIFNKWNYDPSTLRGSYQWVPSEFRICHDSNDTYGVHIETPISHLPMTEELDKTYRNLEKVFAKLVPMFGEILHFDKQKGDTRLQVIVKVQSYHIQPKMKYSGRWHTEGRTENIQAAGVYYLHIDDELEGGALKFRPSVAPSKMYAEWSDFDINRYLMPKTDAAIVFDNSLPHRFCSIRNSTSIARRRTFLNFFVVSPQYPIKALTISNLPLVSYERCWRLLASIENEKDQQKLPDLAIEKILSFLKGIMWESDIDAKEFRARVRHEMMKEKTGWSGIHYGNYGDIVFIKSKNDWNIKRQQPSYCDIHGLEHTESD